jgi:predicted phosphoribosyltransferase
MGFENIEDQANNYQHFCLKKIADETISCIVAQQFTVISSFYHGFEQLTDNQVKNLFDQLHSQLEIFNKNLFY